MWHYLFLLDITLFVVCCLFYVVIGLIIGGEIYREGLQQGFSSLQELFNFSSFSAAAISADGTYRWGYLVIDLLAWTPIAAVVVRSLIFQRLTFLPKDEGEAEVLPHSKRYLWWRIKREPHFLGLPVLLDEGITTETMQKWACDRAFMLGAVQRRFNKFKYASLGLRTDIDFVLACLFETTKAHHFDFDTDNWRNNYKPQSQVEALDMILSNVSQRLLKDRDFMLAAIEISYHCFKFADDQLLADRQFMHVAVWHDIRILELEERTADQTFMIDIISDRGAEASEYADQSLWLEKDFSLPVIQNCEFNTTLYGYVPSHILDDIDFELVILKKGSALFEEFGDDGDLSRAFDPEAFDYLITVALSLVSRDEKNLGSIPSFITASPEFQNGFKNRDDQGVP